MISTGKSRFTLRGLFVAMASVCLLLAAHVELGWFSLCVVWLVVGLVGGAVAVSKRRTIRSVALLGVAFLANLGVIGGSVMFAAGHFGPIRDRTQWPSPLTLFIKRKAADVDTTAVFKRAGLLDREFVWSIKVSQRQMERFAKQVNLREQQSIDSPRRFRKAFPIWMRPRTTSGQFFATDRFSTSSRGGDGEHFMALYDAESRQCYVWYKDNF